MGFTQNKQGGQSGFGGQKKQGGFAGKPAAKPKKQYDLPAAFLEQKENQYGPYWIGEFEGTQLMVAETKAGGKFKLSYGDQFTTGNLKQNDNGEYIPFAMGDMWWYASLRSRKDGTPYMMLKCSGRAVEPREYAVAEGEGEGQQEVVDVIDADGATDEGETIVPQQASRPAPAPKTASKPTLGAIPQQAKAPVPARGLAKKPHSVHKDLSDIPF